MTLARYDRHFGRRPKSQAKGAGALTPAPRTATQARTGASVTALAKPTDKRSLSQTTAQDILASHMGKMCPDLATKLAQVPNLTAADADELLRAMAPGAVNALNAVVVM